MKRLIPILFLMLFSAPVMAEPIEMTCKDENEESTNLTINLATNKVQFGAWKPLDIFFKNDKYIVWVGNHMDKYPDKKLGYLEILMLFSLDRQSGKLQSVEMNLDRDKAGSRSVDQCFRSF